MADFFKFLVSKETEDSTREQVLPVAHEEEEVPSFFDFVRSEFLSDPQEDSRGVPMETDDRSFRRFVSEVLLKQRLNAALKKPSVPADRLQTSKEENEEDPRSEESPDSETTITAEPVAEKPAVTIEQTSRLFPLVSPRKEDEILWRLKQFPPRKRKESPPSLRAIGNFRERTALDILQTLAEEEETEQSEISSEEPAKKQLRIAQFQVAEISQVPSFTQVRREDLQIAQCENLEIHKRRPNIHGGLARLEMRTKPAPRLNRELFRESLMDERRVSLGLRKTEKTEMIAPGKPLGLELFEHVPVLHRLPVKPIAIPCNCPIHRHKVRIASTFCASTYSYPIHDDYSVVKKKIPEGHEVLRPSPTPQEVS